ncbi:MAG: hypothetical protein IJF96_05670 [Firmicutes bacterium]|nr:hypothetical protein [Bacillota bacterium]
MSKLNKVVIIVSKIGEVCCWIACAFMIAMIIVTVTGHPSLLDYLSDVRDSSVLSNGGFELVLGDMAPGHTGSAYIIFFITVLITSALMAMIFRNVYLSFKTAEGKTKFSKGKTPFQPDIVRMIRNVGILSIVIPVVEIIMTIVARVILGDAGIESSLNINGILIGIVVLCLSQFFAYGTQLQEDNDGLV